MIKCNYFSLEFFCNNSMIVSTEILISSDPPFLMFLSRGKDLASEVQVFCCHGLCSSICKRETVQLLRVSRISSFTSAVTS